MGDDFSVGLGLELVPFCDQFVFQLDVILDDAVMHDNNFTRAVAMRMGVFLGRAPMRGPAGVSDAVETFQRNLMDRFFEIAQLSGSAANFELSVVADHGN